MGGCSSKMNHFVDEKKKTFKLKRALNRFMGKDGHFDDNLLKMVTQVVDDPDALDKYKDITISKKSKNSSLKTEKQRFINWGGTVDVMYKQILFPENVQQVQQFVKYVVEKGKSVRGSGIRHSWANVYADPNNFLVSFYPKAVSTGQYDDLIDFVEQIEKRNLDKVKNGLYSIQIIGKHQNKTLVRLGAGVSNEQLRKFCLKNDIQYQANVIMVEVNFCGALGACCHGAGLKNPPICDFIYEIEFINCLGEIQKISKKDHPQFIKSAAGNMGLLGLTVFVTLEMLPQQNAIYYPRKGPTQKIIPRPGQRSKKFEYECHRSYCEWFFFTQQDETYANIFEAVPKFKGEINPQFPPPIVEKLSEVAMSTNAFFAEKGLRNLAYLSFRMPFIFFPGSINPFKKPVKLDYMDAVHFQRAIQNYPCRCFEVLINLPTKEDKLDYQLIQRVWWSGYDYVTKNNSIIDLALQMRLLKGSECPLAPQIDYEYVISIEVLKNPNLNQKEQEDWSKSIEDLWNIWKNIKDYTGKNVTIRPHWAKQWDKINIVKNDLLADTALKASFQRFLQDYEKIAFLGGWQSKLGLKTFSNKLYREFLGME